MHVRFRHIGRNRQAFVVRRRFLSAVGVLAIRRAAPVSVTAISPVLAGAVAPHCVKFVAMSMRMLVAVRSVMAGLMTVRTAMAFAKRILPRAFVPGVRMPDMPVCVGMLHFERRNGSQEQKPRETQVQRACAEADHSFGTRVRRLMKCWKIRS